MLFDNTKIGFDLKSDFELKRALFLFKVIPNSTITKIGTSLLKLYTSIWFFFFKHYDIFSAIFLEQIYRQCDVPALLIGGSKDIQCDPYDVMKIKNIYGGIAEAHIVEKMSHLLRKEEEDPSVFNYHAQLKQTIMPEVLELIDAWLQRELQDKKPR